MKQWRGNGGVIAGEWQGNSGGMAGEWWGNSGVKMQLS